jgi:hypothetical protein
MESYDPEWKRLEFLLNAEARIQSLDPIFRVIPAQENESLGVKYGEEHRQLLPPATVSNFLQNEVQLSKFVTDFHQLNKNQTQ